MIVWILLVTNVLTLIFLILKKIFARKNIVQVDLLTGLQNRQGFYTAIDDLFKKEKPFSIMYCDLDNFKQINDTYGHDVGDELLKKVSTIWTDLKTAKHKVYRLGGDEFSVIVTNASKERVADLAKDMLESVRVQKGKEFSGVTASIGIVRIPDDATDRTTALKYADAAMYSAKNAGKNSYKEFTDDLLRSLLEEYSLERKVKETIASKDFTMVYQPQFKLKNLELIGFEALFRCKGANTQKFILAAESTGDIRELDFKILRKVLEETKPLVERYPNITISVNISGKDVNADSFFRELYNIIRDQNYSENNLKLEITESSSVRNVKTTLGKLKKLKRLGIKIALDDFGTGYSSLEYLTELQPDSVKIDKSFIEVLNRDKRLPQTIINLGHSLGCEIIAEGVETEVQSCILKNLNCDAVQGYYYGVPADIQEALKIAALSDTKKLCKLEEITS